MVDCSKVDSVTLLALDQPMVKITISIVIIGPWDYTFRGCTTGCMSFGHQQKVVSF